MNKLLFHVSNEKYDTLRPKKEDNYEECICFSENAFISYFGQHLYIFDFQTLNSNFNVRKLDSEWLYQQRSIYGNPNADRYKYRSKPLGFEYRIYEPINVDRYALGVAKHWNHMDGELQTLFAEEVIKRESINFASR